MSVLTAIIIVIGIGLLGLILGACWEGYCGPLWEPSPGLVLGAIAAAVLGTE